MGIMASQDYKYGGKFTAFNGLSYVMQEKIKVPKNTANSQFCIEKELNKYFIEFLKNIGELPSKDYTKNAIKISNKYFKQYKEWFFSKF